MAYVYWLLIGVALVSAFWFWYRSRPRGGDSLAQINHGRRRLKERRKKEIMRYVRVNGKVTSRAVERLLGVSSATATRYLQELKSTGELKERGQGRALYYTL